MKTIEEEFELKENQQWQCEKCETLNSESGKFCVECGFEKRNQQWQCNKCETLNNESAKFCMKCGLAKGEFNSNKQTVNEVESNEKLLTQKTIEEEQPSSMGSVIAIVLIMIVSVIITALMIDAEQKTLKYALFGKMSVAPFLPLGFGIIISIVVATLKK